MRKKSIRESSGVSVFVTDTDSGTWSGKSVYRLSTCAPELNVSVARLAYDFIHDLPIGHAYAESRFFPRRAEKLTVYSL
ncbi:MAG: hypothetical protein Q9P01_04815 [Anaerolineae bacterium]|nr:hypothetical protein [Anaerolineae bacterium]